MGNSSASESLRWRESPRQIQNREEEQRLPREAQLPPVPASQQGSHTNGATLLQEDADRREENIEPETNKVPNRIVIFIIIIALVLVLVLIPLSLLMVLIDKMSENNPQNPPTPKYQPAPQLPDPPETQQLSDPPETQPTDSQTTESGQLETQPSGFPESETTELESQSQQAEP